MLPACRPRPARSRHPRRRSSPSPLCRPACSPLGLEERPAERSLRRPDGLCPRRARWRSPPRPPDPRLV
eukprot:7525504-Pyramimonas_sp.AAC.1